MKNIRRKVRGRRRNRRKANKKEQINKSAEMFRDESAWNNGSRRQKDKDE